MENNQNQNANQQPNTQPTETGDRGSEKLFTQEDVDRIVRDRLNRSKNKGHEQDPAEAAEKEAALAEKEAALVSRENRLSCREYLMENGYPVELLDIIDTSNPEEFRTKAEKSAALLKAAHHENYVAPLADLESLSFQVAPDLGNTKHEPKQYPDFSDT